MSKTTEQRLIVKLLAHLIIHQRSACCEDHPLVGLEEILLTDSYVTDTGWEELLRWSDQYKNDSLDMNIIGRKSLGQSRKILTDMILNAEEIFAERTSEQKIFGDPQEMTPIEEFLSILINQDFTTDRCWELLVDWACLAESEEY